ncbi:hypothetical protein FOB22_003790 [Saccharomyces cerevisiae]|nr:hypothetical protein FOB22_003790 [Saccharomyces cerevisiae]
MYRSSISIQVFICVLFLPLDSGRPLIYMIDLSYICSDATVFSGKSRVIFFSNPICEHTRGNFYLFYLNYIINTFAPKNCGTRRCKPFGLHINCRKKIDCLHVQLSYILCKNKSRKRHMDAHAITLAWLAHALT